jgi:hypothetical protein
MTFRSAAAIAFRVALELVTLGISLGIVAAGAYAARTAERK